MPTPRSSLATLLLLAACAAEPRYGAYVGDGRFIDQGPRAAAMRYVVDLGEIDLSRAGTREFSMSGLPPERFTVGLQVLSPVELPGPIHDLRPLGAGLRLELLDERGEIVIAEEAPLGDWVWSGRANDRRESFIYWRGGSGENRSGGAGEGPDGAQGSSFMARSAGRYAVRFTVTDPDPGAAAYTVVARAFGGGWKVPGSGSTG